THLPWYWRAASIVVLLAIAWLLLIVVVALGADYIAPYSFTALDLKARLGVPVFMGGTWPHPLGTDELGRDVLSRLIVSVRMSLLIALFGTMIAASFGTTMGFIAAHFRGRIEALVLVLIDFQAGMPFMIIALSVLAFFGNSLPLFVALMGLYGWERYARIARGLTLAANEQTRKAWPFEFTASYTVELAPDSLLMQLEITNGAAEPMEFTSALHTYFASPDYRQGTLTGLAGLTYWDNGTPWQERQTQNTDALQIADALDRVYFQAHRPLTWQDQARRLEITAEGFADAVVWNPGITGAKALSDMADEEYVQMLCVEAANVAVPIRLEPGAIWRGSQRIQFIG
ncbi:MAG TPA: hypothetical protein PKD17_18115, partial [Cellvibrionaceae bacterium]|nr:hypothetical protein [Cellvibrionaceae bacterium]